MAIKVIAQRREVKLGKNPGKKFVMRPDLYIPIQEKKVFAEASTHSGISAGVIKAAWDDEGNVEDPENNPSPDSPEGEGGNPSTNIGGDNTSDNGNDNGNGNDGGDTKRKWGNH